MGGWVDRRWVYSWTDGWVDERVVWMMDERMRELMGEWTDGSIEERVGE